MKHTGKVILILAIVLVIAGGGVLAYLLTSPQRALSGMVKEINEQGLTAIEGHLTGAALSAYEKVYGVVSNPLVSLALQMTPAQNAVSAIARGAGSLKATYESVKRGWGSASITLRITAPVASGDVQLEMTRKGLTWLIEDIAIPIGSWTIQE